MAIYWKGGKLKLYSIRNWGQLFENNRSRTVVNLDWVSIPNRHDGENYTKIISDQDGAVIFAAWNLMLQVASKCNPRGVLVKDNGAPHNAESLSMKTRAPKMWFDKALIFLELNTDWLAVTDLSGLYQRLDSNLSDDCNEGKGREGKEGKGTIGDFPKEVLFWNQHCGNLPAVASLTGERLKHLRSRRQDSFWVANYENAVLRIKSSNFCTGKNDRGWMASFDWMLRPTTITRIMEGLYDNRKTDSRNGQQGGRKVADRNAGTANAGADYSDIHEKL